VTNKIILLVNFEKTNMNPLHTYTIHTSRYINIPNFLVHPNTPFFLMGFSSGLNTADLVAFSDFENLLLGYCVEHSW